MIKNLSNKELYKINGGINMTTGDYSGSMDADATVLGLAAGLVFGGD